MRAQFLLSGKLKMAQVVRENPLTIIARVNNILGHKFVKRNKVRHNVEILRGRRDLDIGVEERPRRRDIEL